MTVNNIEIVINQKVKEATESFKKLIPIVKQVMKKIQEYFSKIEIGQLEKQIEEFQKNLLSNIDNFAQKINTIDDTFKNLDWSNLGETFGKEIENSLNTINTSLQKMDWQGIANKIQAFFQNLDLSGTVNVGMQIIINLIEGLMRGLPALITTAFDIITNFVEGLTQQLPILIPVAVDMLMTLINSLLENLPKIIESAILIIESLVQGLINALPVFIEWLPTILETFISCMIEGLPRCLETGIEILLALIQGIIDCIPKLIEMLPQIINTIVENLIGKLPDLIDMGIRILIALIDGLMVAIPKLIEMLPQIIITIVTILAQNFPKILEIGGRIITSLITGIGTFIYKIGEASWNIINSIGSVLGQLPGKAIQWGKDMILGFINGIKAMSGNIGNAVSSVAYKVKSFLHFSKPDTGPLREYEKWMPDMVEGLSRTLTASAPKLYNASKDLASKVAKEFDLFDMQNQIMDINTSSILNTIKPSINNSIIATNIQPQNIIEEAFQKIITGYQGSNNNRPLRIQLSVGSKNLVDELIDGINEKTRQTGKAQIKVNYA